MYGTGKCEEKNERISVSVETDGRVRYTVPQVITAEKDVTVYFRVADVYRNVTLKVFDGERVVAQKKKSRMAPGEMESITLKSSAFADAKDLKFVLEVR